MRGGLTGAMGTRTMGTHPSVPKASARWCVHCTWVPSYRQELLFVLPPRAASHGDPTSPAAGGAKDRAWSCSAERSRCYVPGCGQLNKGCCLPGFIRIPVSTISKIQQEESLCAWVFAEYLRGRFSLLMFVPRC